MSEPPVDEPRHLFVYGTLRPGDVRWPILEDYVAGDGTADTTAGEVFDTHLVEVPTEYLEMGEIERNRVFNLGYFTWVEQQGVSIEDFERRRSQDFWQGLRPLVDRWDTMIGEFNAATGARHG